MLRNIINQSERFVRNTINRYSNKKVLYTKLEYMEEYPKVVDVSVIKSDTVYKSTILNGPIVIEIVGASSNAIMSELSTVMNRIIREYNKRQLMCIFGFDKGTEMVIGDENGFITTKDITISDKDKLSVMLKNKNIKTELPVSEKNQRRLYRKLYIYFKHINRLDVYNRILLYSSIKNITHIKEKSDREYIQMNRDKNQDFVLHVVRKTDRYELLIARRVRYSEAKNIARVTLQLYKGNVQTPVIVYGIKEYTSIYIAMNDYFTNINSGGKNSEII